MVFGEQCVMMTGPKSMLILCAGNSDTPIQVSRQNVTILFKSNMATSIGCRFYLCRCYSSQQCVVWSGEYSNSAG